LRSGIARKAATARDFNVCDASEDAVENRRRRQLEPRLALTILALTVDHLEAFTPPIDHLRDDLRRVLHITVDDDYGAAGGGVDSGSESGLMTKVPGEPNTLDALVAGGQLADLLPTLVRGSVIDIEDLETVDPLGQ
jgi:hypothetical protein